jgi:hypothetical protein
MSGNITTRTARLSSICISFFLEELSAAFIYIYSQIWLLIYLLCENNSQYLGKKMHSGSGTNFTAGEQ